MFIDSLLLNFKKIDCRNFFNFVKNYLKKATYFFVDLKFFFFNIFKITKFKVFTTIKGTLPKSLRSLAQKMKEKIDF